jgi:polysaccharide deacetylase family protein (PEP-CTERM system associated)
MTLRNYLTIDVEEYFHVGRPGEGPAEPPGGAGRGRHPPLPGRAEEDVERVLRLLDRRAVRATFFVLGETAAAHPRLVRRIAAAGHEIASHGYRHVPIDLLGREAFEDDLDRAIEVLGSITGARPAGYRAPIWSLGRAGWGLETIASRGFVYDSSAAAVPSLGSAGLPHRASLVATRRGDLLEVPPLSRRFGRWRYPVGFALGLRALPIAAIRRAIAAENRAGFPALVAFHSWELDPDPPALRLRPSLALAHGFGLEKLGARIERLLTEVAFGPVQEGIAATGAAREAA